MSPRTVLLSLLAISFVMRIGAQTGNSISQIIAKISQLESARDPKCYATANRLEDFMYGTPLSDDARNLRIEVQKEVSLFIRNKASEIAKKRGATTIARQDIVMVTDSIATVGTLKDGDYFFRLDTVLLRIRKIDFDQYSSVAYGYRSMLAVEQDLIFLDEISQLPMEDEAVDVLYFFLNLSTLAALNVADMSAREENAHLISGSMMRDSWLRIFQKPKNQELLNFKYPEIKDLSGDNSVLKQIVQQKIESYDQYNQLSNSVFLRNIQVFFARQKWPVEQEMSDAMRSYLIESLVVFTKEVIKYSEQFSRNRNEAIIRIADVQSALQLFLPFEVNDFEDVIFFPKDQENRITIEAYDLDAFRDGGIHWRILGYALDDPDVFKKVIDPTAAELVVEGIAQLGVLILRQAGIISHEAKSEVLTLHDLEAAFQQTQEIISNYSSLPEISEKENKIQSHSGSAVELVFQDVTDEVGISFEHRSSDWLSRLIRSYVFSPDNNTAKLAIPPAFGGSGVAAEDINNDGFVDILLLGGIGNKLYINDQKGHFNEVSEGLPFDHFDSDKKSLGEVRQPIIADLNNDGFQDIIIIYVDDLHRVYKNLDGTHFADITDQVNLDGKEAVAGPATVLDYDNDGLLDLFIGYFGNYIQGQLPTLSRNNQNGMPNRLYRNLGDFKFEEVTFTLDSLTDNGWTQAAGHTDINQDGRQDLIVGNDFGVNRYYLNTPDRGFIEMSKVWKTDKPSYTMNVGIGDLNADQHPDLYISNIVVMQKEEKYVSPNEATTMKFDPEKMTKIRTVEANDLFISDAQSGEFKGFTLSEDIGRGFSSTGWSWDADFFDFDNDGDEDLYCLNGMNDFRVYSTENPFYYGSDEAKDISYAESDREKNVFFVNEDGLLVNHASQLGADLLSNSRSAAYLDFDNDGDEDVIINNYHDQAVFLKNTVRNGNNWLKIKLIGDPEHGVNRDAIGTSMTVMTGSGAKQWREVHSTTGYLSVHPKEQHFGLGSEEKATITVKWPNGDTYELTQVEGNQRYIVKYPNIILN